MRDGARYGVAAPPNVEASGYHKQRFTLSTDAHQEQQYIWRVRARGNRRFSSKDHLKPSFVGREGRRQGTGRPRIGVIWVFAMYFRGRVRDTVSRRSFDGAPNSHPPVSRISYTEPKAAILEIHAALRFWR